MKQCLRDCCLFYYHKNGKFSGLLVFHVDDFLSSGDEDFKRDIMLPLRNKYSFGKISSKHFTFTGLNIFQNENYEIFVDQEDFISKMNVFEFEKQNSENTLNKYENTKVRKTTGQLNWLSSQTRPDLSFDALKLSMNLNYAKNKDAKTSKKVVMKAKQEKVAITFSHVGELKDLKLEVFADASFTSAEEQNNKSVMGLIILLRGKENTVNPLHWKSKVIDKVAEDIKSAETLALETAVDDARHLADMITEITSTTNSEEDKIPLIINEDSKSLVESLYSTKKVKRKTMRVILSSLQQQMKKGRIKEIHHVPSQQQLADVLTKKGVNSDFILDTVSTGTLKIDRISK